MKKFISVFTLLVVFALVFAAPALAQRTTPQKIGDSGATEKLSTQTDAGAVINNVVLYLTYILAGLFVLMILIGAIMYMVYPDAEKKQKGMSIIQAAIIAGVLALLSYAIWNILDNLL